ncbi:MAG: pyridoxal phosphate-dependent aminotransferase [Candidatus Eisenbacteria bacterium]|uniref:Aminotransferase n=1 Tax=Eiseniibacteriota bacterium TaxID=2212470 RepID=A0A948RTR4_UNCEI|nr:pyridoxal phosphate-dependent aminotransferase [Candidatus Eisenbacteria bacterium]MBU1949408.1 pyridoxal phosphate-dependent aminotransferase [Candidatus Eisenbacteria bacterium]MBU2689564.1 pyridoxal phosphate-dependent aminotransferase [Candidatus Eisenbacteria bacterium]
MPHYPRIVPAVTQIPSGFTFSPLAQKLAKHKGPLFPLHVGDTWMEPFEGGRMENLLSLEHDGLHRYTAPRGIREVIETVAAKVVAENKIPCTKDSVIMTAGATGALASAIGATISEGDEVLILSPFWPLIRNIVRTFRGTPVEVPFYDRIVCDCPPANKISTADEALAAVQAKYTPRTAAIYVSTPNNPTGAVLSEEILQALASWASAKNLWIFSDEVYEYLAYTKPHISIARFAPERTLTAFSFSKTYGMAGNRAGYLVGPQVIMDAILKVSTHLIYSAPTAGQIAGMRAIQSGGAWLDRARAQYQEIGDEMADLLSLPRPEGSTFLFFDASPHLDDRGIGGFLEDCLEDGVVLTPGSSCGAGYENWVRLCYTCVAPDATREGVRRLASRMEAG